MDKSQDKRNKWYCARCFMPVDADDNVDIDGQHYHKICSMCCICRQVPRSLKTFYGHVFCQECFKRHVLNKFCGDSPSVPCRRWLMQWAPAPAPPAAAPAPAPAAAFAPLPGSPPHHAHNNKCCFSKAKKNDEGTASKNDGSKKSKIRNSDKAKETPHKKCFCACARCLQNIDGETVEIEGQSFHEKCAKCCCCHRVPTSPPKIFNRKVFCAACYQRVMNLNRKPNYPEEFYRECCEQWKNPQAAAHVKQLMAGNNAAWNEGAGGGEPGKSVGEGGAGRSRGGSGGGRARARGWPAEDSLTHCDAGPPAPAARDWQADDTLTQCDARPPALAARDWPADDTLIQCDARPPALAARGWPADDTLTQCEARPPALAARGWLADDTLTQCEARPSALAARGWPADDTLTQCEARPPALAARGWPADDTLTQCEARLSAPTPAGLHASEFKL